MSTAEHRRQDRERQFHDALFEDDSAARDETRRFYSVVERSQDAYWQAVESRAPGADCLEYGTARGDGAIRVAGLASSVVGMDISGVAVDKAGQAAAAAGSKARFEVAEAESLPFADSTFDLAFGESVLHHLELAPALDEMARVLRPSGSGVFFEPLGHNRIINWYRDRTPQMRTPDEHPLVRSDFELFESRFQEVKADFFHLAVLAAVPLLGKRGFRPVMAVLDKLDDYAMGAVPPLRWQAWVCVLRLQGPRKT